jgi:hypothetical protein
MEPRVEQGTSDEFASLESGAGLPAGEAMKGWCVALTAFYVDETDAYI